MPYKGLRGQGCKCGAHRQHQLYSFLFFNPGANLRDAALGLHITHAYARMLSTRLHRRKDFGRLCPLCFESRFYNGSCQGCGFVMDGKRQGFELDFDGMSPVHRILPDKGLGSQLSASNYATIARRTYGRERLDPGLLRTHARDLSHLAEPREDRLLKGVCSKLLENLKSSYPEDGISEMAARLAVEEVKIFRMNYRSLKSPKGLADQLASNVLRRLELLSPHFRDRNSATPVLVGEEAQHE